MVKVIALKSINIPTAAGWPSISLAPGQTYEVNTATSTSWIAQGVAISHSTALSNSKCPTVIRTTPIKIH